MNAFRDVFFDRLGRLAGEVGAIVEAGAQEARGAVRAVVERSLQEFDVVSREEHEAARDSLRVTQNELRDVQRELIAIREALARERPEAMAKRDREDGEPS